MSLILEALKKSEARRQLGEAPGIGTPFTVAPRRRSMLPLLVVLILVAGGLGWYFLRTPVPVGETGKPMASAEQTISSAAKPAAVAPAGTRSVPPAPAAGGAPSPANATPGGEAGRALAGPQANAPLRTLGLGPATRTQGPAGEPAGLLQQRLAKAHEARSALAGNPNPTAQPPLPPNSAAAWQTRQAAAAQRQGPPNIAVTAPLPPAPPAAEQAQAAARQARQAAAAQRQGPPNIAATAPLPPAPPAAEQAAQVAARQVGQATAAPPVAPTGSTAPVPAPTMASATQAPQPGVPKAPGAPIGTVADLPMYYELPYNVRKDLPTLTISMHVFAAASDQRFVMIDGERKAEGETFKDVTLREIRPDGMVLEFRGQRFFYPRSGH